MPLRPAASSLADSPSTMKLFERLRWLPTDRLTPGTADVSGNSCVLRDVRRRDAGHEQRQLEEVAAVQRQVSHFASGHRAGDLAARRFEHGRLRR